jgi:hypothetical protein
MKMNKQIFRLTVISLLMMLMTGAIKSGSKACTFVGIVRNPEVDFVETSYNDLMNYMAEKAEQDETNAGWSVFPYIYYSSNIGHYTRTPGPSTPYQWIGNPLPTTEYFHAYDFARTWNGNEATLVVAHARHSSNHDDAENPHPFVYDFDNDPPGHPYYRMFGKPYSFLHNGSLYVEDYSWYQDPRFGTKNKTGPAFCALDLFWNRYWAAWSGPSQGHPIDSEHYVMLMMKYLLVQQNYYWAGPSNTPPTPPGGDQVGSPEEWAVRRVAQDMPTGEWIQYHQDSMNGILTDGCSMWVVAKADGAFPHTVGYDQVPEQSYRKVASAIAGNTDFVRLVEHHIQPADPWNGQVACVTYDNVVVHNMDPSGALIDPLELRVNSRTHSIGDQDRPAISVSPSDGSWVAVWASNDYEPCGEVVGRWYNQMGMAENDEFAVSTNSEEVTVGHPAIAHSDDGQTITVVWDEEDPGISSRILRRTYDWVQETHSWGPRAEGVVEISTQQTAPGVSNPTIAYDDMGNYGVA